MPCALFRLRPHGTTICEAFTGGLSLQGRPAWAHKSRCSRDRQPDSDRQNEEYVTTCPQRKIRYTFQMSVKEQVLQAIQRLPNDIDFRDVTEEVALLAAVQEAERDIEDGRLISNEEMKSRIGQWSAR